MTIHIGRNAHLRGLAMALVGLTACSSRAALLVYDGFDYTPGNNVLTPLNGGYGFSNAWARAEEGANDTYTAYTGAPKTGTAHTNQPTVVNFDGVFNNPAVTTSPPGAGNRYIDGASGDDRLTGLRKLSQSAGALAGVDKVLWASVLWTMNGNNYGRQVGFALGSDGLRNRSQNVSVNTAWGGTGAGDAIGVGGAINSSSVTPTIWDGGAIATRTTTGAKTLSTSYDNIVILKYVFADGTDPDRVYAWGFSENDTITEDAFNTSAIYAEAVIDQDTLDILSFGQSQVGIETVDEIRLGDTFADVTTGTAGEPRQPLEITRLVREPGGSRMTLSWKSNADEHYGIFWSTNLETFEPGISPDVPAQGTNTTYGPFDSPAPEAGRLFLRLGSPDLADPTLAKVWGSGTNVTLVFSEAMRTASATTAANFAVQKDGGGAVAVNAAALSPDGTTVTLSLASPLAIASSYTVTMNNLADRAGRPLGSGATGGFQTWDDNPDGVKVVILAGQSNMVGNGKTEDEPTNLNGLLGTLRYLAIIDTDGIPPHYRDLLEDPTQPDTSPWKVRSDVKVWWKDGYVDATRNIRKGDLSVNFGKNAGWIGPEFGVGQIIGDHYTNAPVLIIKAAWGGIDLAQGFRPPSAAAARGGTVGPYYRAMLDDARDVLNNLGTEFPEWAGMGYQIVGFGWHQGYNDRIDATKSAEYEANLVDLINDLRAEFGKPNLPVSIGTTGMAISGDYSAVELAQLAVGNPAQHPEFHTPASTVFTIDTRSFWRDSTVSPSDFGYHWNHNGETYYLIGHHMGLGMQGLLGP